MSVGEENKTLFIRVWKPLPSRRVVQYLPTMGLGVTDLFFHFRHAMTFIYGCFLLCWLSQDHLAPSGYLKLPNVSTIPIASFVFFIWSSRPQKRSLNWLVRVSFYFQAIPKYLEKCKFLPKLNNERPQAKNPTYKERFSSLQNLVLIMVGLKGALLSCQRHLEALFLIAIWKNS